MIHSQPIVIHHHIESHKKEGDEPSDDTSISSLFDLDDEENWMHLLSMMDVYPQPMGMQFYYEDGNVIIPTQTISSKSSKEVKQVHEDISQKGHF